MAEELELPRIQPKGQDSIHEEKYRYNTIRSTGPESLRHFKRTYLQALRRQIASGSYDPRRPRVIPFREDRRYRSWTVTREPMANAAIIYMMDVSGSMTDDQKRIVRTEAFWIDTWIKSQYEGVQRRYIIHDALAREVDEETFYRTRESGGTRISTAYEVCLQLIRQHYPPEQWNIYCFQFSDGDNWGEDNRRSIRLLREQIAPQVNLFCYGQVESPYGSGDYLRALESAVVPYHDNVITSQIPDENAIYDSIRTFLGKGK